MTQALESGPAAATPEAAYEKFVWANLKRNFVAIYAHGMLGLTGFRVINAPTFLPAYIFAVSGSSAIVGLSVALQQVGMIVSPVITANLIEHRPKILPAVVWIGGLARLQILGMALAGWFLKGDALVAGLLLFIALFGVFMGAQRVVVQTLISKAIPITRRGRLEAWRSASGGVIAAGLSYLAGRYLIETHALGNGYATTFLLAAIITTSGIMVLQAVMREPENVTVRVATPLLQRLRDFPALLAGDRHYMFFVMTQAIAVLARMAVPLYILYASQMIKMTGGSLGVLSVAYLGADTFSNIVWGYLGDKRGFRIVILLSLLLWLASTVLLMTFGHNIMALAAAFFGLGASQSGYLMGSQTMILEFGKRSDLPMRMALSATVEGLFGSIGPLMGGILATSLSYPGVFSISAGLLATAFCLLAAKVPEPRFRPRLADGTA